MFWWAFLFFSASGENFFPELLRSNEVPGVENRLHTWLTYCGTSKIVSLQAGLSLQFAGGSLHYPV